MKTFFLIMSLLCISLVFGVAQENEIVADSSQIQEKVKIRIKGENNPDIYIEGKKYDYAIFELLDKNKIESISVIKGEQAQEEFGSVNDVIVVNIKKDKEKVKIRSFGNEGNEAQPVVIINGEKSDKEALSKLSPDDIESIVFTGDKALTKYNSLSGAIVVTTKKKKE